MNIFAYEVESGTLTGNAWVSVNDGSKTKGAVAMTTAMECFVCPHCDNIHFQITTFDNDGNKAGPEISFNLPDEVRDVLVRSLQNPTAIKPEHLGRYKKA